MTFPTSYNYYSLNSATSTGAGSVIDVTGLDQTKPPTIFFLISGSATIQMQVSPDKVNWVNFGAAITASGEYSLPPAGVYYRPNVTVYGSGTISVIVGPGQTTDGEWAGVSAPSVSTTGVQ